MLKEHLFEIAEPSVIRQAGVSALWEKTFTGIARLQEENIEEVNPAFAQLLGYERSELVERTILDFVVKEDINSLKRILSQATEPGILRFIASDGRPVNVEARCVEEAGSAPGRQLLFVHNKGQEKQMKQAFHTMLERYSLLTRSSREGLWDWNVQSGALFLSHSWKKLLGFAQDEILGDTQDDWLNMIHPSEREDFAAELKTYVEEHRDHFEVEFRILHKDDKYRWVLCTAGALRDETGRATRIAGSLTNLGIQRLNDSLTGLPSRRLFLNILSDSLGRAQDRQDYVFSVVAISVRNHQRINDSLGSTIGRQLLEDFAWRLHSLLRPTDVATRIEGNEFAILLDDLREKQEAVQICAGLQETLKKPFLIDGHELFADISLGMTLSERKYNDAEAILDNALLAMHRPQASVAKSPVLYRTTMQLKEVKRLLLENDLRQALKKKEFEVHYQPIVSTESLKLLGFESLIRWKNESRGYVYPDQFIPLAEETGLIIPIGKWVLQESCRQLVQWMEKFPSNQDLSVSVNISIKQLLDSTLPDIIDTVLQETGLEPKHLKLEITESILMENVDNVTEQLKQIQSKGIQLYMDDFGTGYSSLSYLLSFPFDLIKVDRSFVGEMIESPKKSALLETIALFASKLGLQLIAEGVETQEQLSSLKQMGYKKAQGWLFSKALPPHEAEAILADDNFNKTFGVIQKES